MNEQKQNIMKNLHLTSAEADELLAYDKRIDRVARVEHDLPPEQEKEAKKMVNVTTHKPRKKIVSEQAAQQPTTQTGLIRRTRRQDDERV